MNSGRILTSLAVCLSFWIAIVLLLLFTHGDLSNMAIATPIAANIDKQDSTASKLAIPEITSLPAAETSQTPHTEITGEIKRGESFNQAMKRLSITDSVRSDIIEPR